MPGNKRNTCNNNSLKLDTCCIVTTEQESYKDNSMKVTLLDDRVGQNNQSKHGHIIKAGAIVTVTGWDEASQRWIGKAGIWTLNFTEDQACPNED